MTRKRSINKPENKQISTPKLDQLITESKKQYGGDVIKKAKNITPVSYIHTGIFAIDLATLGGFVDHQTSLVTGWESSCKTTISYRLIANAQKKYPDKKAVFLDAETHFDKEWASIQGVDVDNLLIVSDLGDGEYYRDVMDATISTGETSIVVLDSIAALVPFDDINKSAKDEVKIGARAKLVGRIYSTIIHGKQELGKRGIKDPMIILINQWRNTIAFMGDSKTLPGGNSQKFLSYLTFEAKKGKPVLPNAKKHPELHKVDKETVIAKSFKFKIIKSKSGMSHDSDEYEYVVSNKFPDRKVGDIDEITMIVNHAKKCGLLTGAGAGQKLCLYENESFNSMGMIGVKLEQEPEKLELLKAMIVAIHRKNNGKSAIPSDGMLMGVQGSRIIKALENAGT